MNNKSKNSAELYFQLALKSIQKVSSHLGSKGPLPLEWLYCSCIRQGQKPPGYPVSNTGILPAPKRMNLLTEISLILILIISPIFLFTGCSPSQPAPASSPSITTMKTSVISSPNFPDKQDDPTDSSPVEDRKTQDADDAGDDSSGDLDDMYFRIYGETNVSYKGEVPFFDEANAYGEILKIPENRYKTIYQEFLGKAAGMEKEGKFADAVMFYRKAAFIEKSGKYKVTEAHSALKRIRREMFDRASDLCKKRRYKEALPFSDIAVLCDPSDGESLKLAGIIFSETGEEGLGISYLSVAVTKLNKDYELQHKLKTLYLLEGMPEKAIPLINSDSARYGRMKSVSEELASAYLMIYIKSPAKREEMTPLIRDALKKAIESRSESKPAATELKMNLSLFDGKYKEALKYCDEMLKMDFSPSIKTRLIYDKGLLYYLIGDRKKSVEYLTETIDRVLKGNGRSQGENYMAQMSCWFLDVTGERAYTARRAEEIYSHVFNPDHSYRQEYGFIKEFLENRERKNSKGAIAALKRYTGKRHLEPVGNFVEDLLQVPAQKALIYISMGEMYQLSGDKGKAQECFKKADESPFGLIVQKNSVPEGGSGK